MVTAATVGVISFPGFVQAERRSRSDSAQPIDLGVKPTASSPGAVVVQKNRLTFVTFHATQHNDVGSPAGTGTAMIALEGCLDSKFRCAGDELQAPHPVDIEKLDACEVYGVTGSSWVESWEEVVGSSKPRLEHYIFTFLGVNPGVCIGAMHFECLAQNVASVDFFPNESFGEMLEYMTFLDENA
jgi:hypothetical protein